MAPLLKRYYCNDNDGYDDGYCTTPWENWVRWLVLALIILGALLIFFLFSCITARRRRRLGYAPYRGTGWAAGRHGPVTYNQQYAQPQQEQPVYNNSNNPPPAYGAATDYYGRNNNIELQQPADTYQPPKGPPPGRS